MGVSTVLDGLSAVDRAELGALLQREALKDKSYQLLPLGMEAAGYLRSKRKRLTKDSYRDYESCLDKLARHFADLEICDFEPPVGTERLEEFLDERWGNAAPRTYNKNLSIVKDFFKWAILREKLHGDPTLAIERARSRQVYRTTFTVEQRRAIVAEQESLRDRIALRLLLDYGLRRGSLQSIQFKHFDHVRKRLTIFAKGGKVRALPIPDSAFWEDLGRHIIDVGAGPSYYLMARRGREHEGAKTEDPTLPMGVNGLHRWWYRCLANAGVVPEGTTRGERMHKARHTAGQRVLDSTGNLKAVQKLLGHTSIQTTGDLYTDWDADQLAATMAAVLAADQEAE